MLRSSRVARSSLPAREDAGLLTVKGARHVIERHDVTVAPNRATKMRPPGRRQRETAASRDAAFAYALTQLRRAQLLCVTLANLSWRMREFLHLSCLGHYRQPACGVKRGSVDGRSSGLCASIVREQRSRILAALSRGLEDELGYLVRMRDQREMARLDFNGFGSHAPGHETFKIRVDRPVLRGNRIETRL